MQHPETPLQATAHRVEPGSNGEGRGQQDKGGRGGGEEDLTWHPPTKAPPPTATSHAHGVERGAIRRYGHLSRWGDGWTRRWDGHPSQMRGVFLCLFNLIYM